MSCSSPGWPDVPDFTHEDLELAMDLGTVLGQPYPRCVALEDEARPARP